MCLAPNFIWRSAQSSRLQSCEITEKVSCISMRVKLLTLQHEKRTRAKEHKDSTLLTYWVTHQGDIYPKKESWPSWNVWWHQIKHPDDQRVQGGQNCCPIDASAMLIQSAVCKQEPWVPGQCREICLLGRVWECTHNLFRLEYLIHNNTVSFGERDCRIHLDRRDDYKTWQSMVCYLRISAESSTSTLTSPVVIPDL